MAMRRAGAAHVLRTLAKAALIFAVLPFAVVTTALAGTVDEMAGRWSGWGSVQMENGQTEQVKCVATYFVERSGAGVRQNLRCASSSYAINARADYQVKGSDVTGNWEELTHSAKGQIKGSLKEGDFKLAIAGDTFTAVLQMTSAPCQQSINISPQNLGVRRISIGLKKC
ncbi:MAG: hypothetical protein NW217_12680 [Hyphomicrobiaceae bacterium]|nr:hypothetical protein [Hyphomicrobiaceae bacterium]